MTALLIATRNAHKAGEIVSVLGDQFLYLTLKDFPAAPPIAETADTFAGNASLKASGLAQWLAEQPANGQPHPHYILADDSGLAVDSLGGQPGVYSARFASAETRSDGNAPDADNNAKLMRLLKDVPPEKRTARFHCVLSLLEMAATGITGLKTFEGVCEGQINFGPNGHHGFGYDPLFVPHGFDQTFAELGEDVKNKISHRARALGKLKAYLTNKPSR